MPALPLKIAAALGIPVLGLGELALHQYFAHRAPTPEQWQEARPAVMAVYRPGDLVVVAPYWAEPIARWKLGDPLFPIREVARPDATRYARAIELSAIGAHSDELAGWRVASESRAGKISIRVLENPVPVAVKFDFTDHIALGQAVAEQLRGGTRTPCPFNEHAPVEAGGLGAPPAFPAQRFVCPGGGSAAFVGVTVLDSPLARPRRCAWTYSVGGSETVVRFAHVPLGSVIRGHTSISYLFERDETGPPMKLSAFVDGAPVGVAVHVDGDAWKPFEFPLGARAGGQGEVEFRVTSETGASRELCFEADTR